jgi:hypothetical protein
MLYSPGVEVALAVIVPEPESDGPEKLKVKVSAIALTEPIPRVADKRDKASAYFFMENTSIRGVEIAPAYTGDETNKELPQVQQTLPWPAGGLPFATISRSACECDRSWPVAPGLMFL